MYKLARGLSIEGPASLSTSGVILSGPGAFPLFSWWIVCSISSAAISGTGKGCKDEFSLLSSSLSSMVLLS